jgi:hypothetical protein
MRRDEALDLLIEAAPSYWAADDLHDLPKVLEDQDDPDLFVRMSAFAIHLVRLIEQRDDEQVSRVFAAVEEVFEHGDASAIELIKLGMLEVLQNVVSHSDVEVSSEDVRARLGSAAGRAWDELAELWTASEAQLGDAGPTESDYLRVEDPSLRLYFQTQTRALADGRLISASQVLKHEAGLLDTLRSRQRRALRRILVFVLVVLALAAVWAVYR